MDEVESQLELLISPVETFQLMNEASPPPAADSAVLRPQETGVARRRAELQDWFWDLSGTRLSAVAGSQDAPPRPLPKDDGCEEVQLQRHQKLLCGAEIYDSHLDPPLRRWCGGQTAGGVRAVHAITADA